MILNLILTIFPVLVAGQYNSNSNGGPIVHLFQWKWHDIARECETFLYKHHFGGVQISPPNEHVIIEMDEISRPWWEVYQPVSYKLVTRFGNEEQLRDMVDRCNAVGVRIYVDAVINHMSNKDSSNIQATAGSKFDGPSQTYPDYNSKNFNDDNCHSENGNVDEFGFSYEVRDCKLLGLNDLDLSQEYVQSKIVGYLNNLIDIGVAGFRIDAAKYMHPEDLEDIYGQLHSLNTKYFAPSSTPFIYQEVIDVDDGSIDGSEYFDLGYVTEFKYCDYIGAVFRGAENFQLADLQIMGVNGEFIPSDRALVFVDNHDNQRGHGAGGDHILTFKEPRLYRMALGFTLAHPYGYNRIMSSYEFNDSNMGPPHDEDQNISSPTFTSEGVCEGEWICEHRWRQIYAIVDFADVVNGTDLSNWWDNGVNQIAFSRGTQGFVAFNNDNEDLYENIQTGLPEGTYCDVISGNLEDGTCTGRSFTVSSDGLATVEISADDTDGFIALHIHAMY